MKVDPEVLNQLQRKGEAPRWPLWCPSPRVGLLKSGREPGLSPLRPGASSRKAEEPVRPGGGRVASALAPPFREAQGCASLP